MRHELISHIYYDSIYLTKPAEVVAQLAHCSVVSEVKMICSQLVLGWVIA